MKLPILILISLISLNVAASEWHGKPAPFFDLPDQNGKFYNLNDFKDQWLVLYFYPKDDTPGCTTEAINFTKDLDKFKQKDVQIVGVSVDDVDSHKEFADKYNITFPLLADKDKVMSEEYKVLNKVPLFHHASRQTFIINPQGVISWHYESVDPDTHAKSVYERITDLMKK